MRATFLALLFSGAACVHSYACPKRGGPTWRELQSSHFLLRTNLADGQANALLDDLEETLLAMTAIWPAAPPPRVQVFAPRDARETSEFISPRDLLGHPVSYIGFFGDPVIVIDGSKPIAEQDYLRRNLASLMVQQNLLRSPIWIQIGLPLYLDSIRTDRTRRVAIAGDTNREMIGALLQVGAAPVEWVLRADPASRDHSLYVETCWLLVNHLMGEETVAMRAYLRALAEGRDPEEAWKSNFSRLKMEDLDAALASHLATRNVTVISVAMPLQIAPVAASRPLADAELHAQRAESRLHVGFAVGDITDEAREAQHEDPANPLGIAIDESLTASEKLRLAETASAARPDDWRIWFLRWSLAEQIASGERSTWSVHPGRMVDRYAQYPRTLETEEAAWLQTALRLKPDNVFVLSASTVARLAERNATAALPLAETANALAPARPLLLDQFALALAGVGRCTDALRVEEQAIAREADLRVKEGLISFERMHTSLEAEYFQQSEELHRRLGSHLEAFRTGCH
ncbi:MAG: hypothetical protein E6J78_13790 [Deltaproteobacteria bacterium]|nr:MAG: hypothetical protein E6J78_13790 [Deltaproteobacteria bacterium]